jgi:hypothetical protein
VLGNFFIEECPKNGCLL